MKPDPHTPKRKLSTKQLIAQREEEIARIAELIATIERKLEWEIANRDQIIAREVEKAKADLRAKIKEGLRADMKEGFKVGANEGLRAEVKEELRVEVKEELREEMQEEFREKYEKLEKLKKEVGLQKESLRKDMELMAMCRLLFE